MLHTAESACAGKFGYDEHSIVGDALDPESKEAWEDPKHPLKGQLENKMLVASQVDPSKVGWCITQKHLS